MSACGRMTWRTAVRAGWWCTVGTPRTYPLYPVPTHGGFKPQATQPPTMPLILPQWAQWARRILLSTYVVDEPTATVMALGTGVALWTPGAAGLSTQLLFLGLVFVLFCLALLGSLQVENGCGAGGAGAGPGHCRRDLHAQPWAGRAEGGARGQGGHHGGQGRQVPERHRVAAEGPERDPLRVQVGSSRQRKRHTRAPRFPTLVVYIVACCTPVSANKLGDWGWDWVGVPAIARWPSNGFCGGLRNSIFGLGRHRWRPGSCLGSSTSHPPPLARAIAPRIHAFGFRVRTRMGTAGDWDGGAAVGRGKGHTGGASGGAARTTFFLPSFVFVLFGGCFVFQFGSGPRAPAVPLLQSPVPTPFLGAGLVSHTLLTSASCSTAI